MTSSSPSKPDYWKLAYDSLEPHIRGFIDSSKTYKRDVVAAALKVANDKHELCLRKRWKVKNFHGEAIVVRDVVEKVVKWITKFKEIGDIAVQYDPVHASLPWAGVRLLLQLASNDAQVFCAMAENVETISRFVSCYKAFENFYMPSASAALTSQIGDALVKLYAKVLIFLAHTIKYFGQKTPVRMITNVFKDADSQHKKAILAVEADLLKLVNLADVESLLNVQKVVEDLSSRFKAFEDDHEHKELIRWISPINFHANHQDQLDKHIPGTGQWLLDHPEYKRWKSASSSSIFLLHGIPGCGKSILSSSVIEQYLNERQNIPVTEPFAYFYCADYENERDRSQPQEILRSIVRQLTMSGRPRPEVRHILSSEFEQLQARSKVEGVDMIRPRIGDCERLIMNVTVDNSVTIVVDALDEIPDSERYVLLDLFERIVANAQNLVKIFLTSRSDSGIFDALPTASRFCIQCQDTRIDMERFIRQMMSGAKGQGNLLKSQDPALQENLVQTLLKEAGEMFQWAKCQFDLFRQLRVEEDIVKSIQHKHFDSLDQTYKKIFYKLFNNSGPSARKMAIDTISWLLYAQEPLTTDAFNSAINSGSKPDVVDICSNLVVLDNGSGMFRFSHQSVQEFARELPEFEELNAHCTISLRCIESCSSFFADQLPNSGSLDRYSMLYWAYHSGLASQKQQASDLSRCMRHFMYDDDGEMSQSFINWLEAIRQISASLERDHSQLLSLTAVHAADPFDPTPFFAACVFGLDGILNEFEMNTLGQIDWDRKNSLNQTGLYLAAAMGHERIIRKLLQHGADINAECPKRGNPVAAACFVGHLTSVRLLLENGASVPTSKTILAALDAAFHGGQENAVLDILAHSRVQLDQAIYDSAILGASQHGFLGVIGKLQDPKLAAAFAQTNPHTRIDKVIGGGHIAALKRSAKDPANLLSSLPVDAVSTAALYGRDQMLVFLLDNGLSIEEEGTLGTPLRAACLMNHQHIAQLLIARNADVNFSGKLGDALQAAAMKGHSQMVRLLLDNGANPHAKGGIYGNALQAAAYHDHIDVAADLGNLEILRQLLEVSDDIPVVEALEYAAMGGYVEMVELLLKQPAVDSSSKAYLLPLLRSGNATLTENSLKLLSKQLSATELTEERVIALTKNAERSSVSPRVIELLLGTQPSIDARLDNVLASCLCTSTIQGRLETVLFLVGQLSPGKLGSDLEVLIALAAENGHLTIVKELYERISRRDSAPGILSHALVAASRYGHLSTVEFILARGVSVDAKASSASTCSRMNRKLLGITPLQACLLGFASIGQRLRLCTDSINGRAWNHTTARMKAVLKLLISVGANPNDMGGMNSYPIIYASAYCDSEDLRHLINAGADVNAVHSGDSALHAVVQREMFAHTLLKQLLDADAILPLTEGATNPLLDKVLRFFDEDGHFLECESLEQVFEDGPGTVIVDLLTSLPEEKVTDERYGLVLQMAACLGRTFVVEMLLKRGIDVNIAGHHFGTALQAASYHGNIETARLLLENGADPNILQGRYQTALRAAVIGNHKDLVNLLIDNDANLEVGAEVQVQYRDRSQPIIHLAVRNAAVDILKVLLEAGADARKEYSVFEHPLIAACEKGDYDKVEVLLQAGSAINVSGSNPPHHDLVPDKRVSALHAACHGGFSNIASLLLNHGADPYSSSSSHHWRGVLEEGSELIHVSSTALDLAAANGHLDCVVLVLDLDTNTDHANYKTALLKASENGHLDVVEEFLSRGLGTANVPDAFLSACQSCNLQLIETFLELVLNYQDTEEMLKKALNNTTGNRNVFELLLDYSVVDTDTLILSCIAGSLTGIKLALESGVSVDAEDALGRRGLHAAAYNRRPDIVQELIGRSADVNYVHATYGSPLISALEGLLAYQLSGEKPTNTTQDGRTEQIKLRKRLGCSNVPAYRSEWFRPSSAQLLGCEHVVQYLLLHGARCDDESGPYGNALHLAVLSGSVAIVQLILENGGDIDNSGALSRNPLMTALNEKHLDVFELLLERGADLQYTTDEGLTPLHVACRTGMSSAIRQLVAHGANVNAKNKQGLTPLSDALQALQESESQLGRQENLLSNPVDVLLRSSPDVEVREDHLHQAAAVTVGHGQQSVLKLLLDYDKCLVVSESVIMTSLTNSWTDERDLLLLLSRSDDLGVTAPILKVATDVRVMKVLLGHRPICRITPEILEANNEWACVQMLLVHDQNVKPTDRVIIRALKSSDIPKHSFRGVKISLKDIRLRNSLYEVKVSLRELLDRNPDLQVTQEMLESTSYPKDMECLLARLPPQKRISESVVLAAINKQAHEIELLRLLLNHDKTFKVSPKVIQQALLKSRFVYIFEILLEHDPNIGISAEIFLCMFGKDMGSEQRREKLIELMDKYNKKVVFTETIKGAIDRSYPSHNQQAMRRSLHSLEDKGS
ncbi:hypothetical protein KCU73_g1119, partial [Aureobasidium melanogenum]